jgi:hypothetical protein
LTGVKGRDGSSRPETEHMKEERHVKKIIGIGILALCGAIGFGQTASAPGTIHARKAHQQARIAQGVKSGQLTAHETAHLERREAGINREERHMRAADNGHLTSADRAKINRQQNRTSRAIYRDKHNAAAR